MIITIPCHSSVRLTQDTSKKYKIFPPGMFLLRNGSFGNFKGPFLPEM